MINPWTMERVINRVQYSQECPAELNPLRWKAMLKQVKSYLHWMHTMGLLD